MSGNKDNATIVGVGVAACAACCAGPMLAVLAAIGLGTAAGFAVFGLIAIAVGAAIAAFVAVRRRRRASSCAPVSAEPTPVHLSVRTPQ